ncbi:unnamed protein product [Linum tenue]|nr:unnamed protein product [Linum tenue]
MCFGRRVLVTEKNWGQIFQCGCLREGRSPPLELAPGASRVSPMRCTTARAWRTPPILADQNRKSRKQQPLYLVEGKFGCLKGVSLIEVPSFTTILKHSNFNQVDRADCQFYMTATTIDNGSQPLRFA